MDHRWTRLSHRRPKRAAVLFGSVLLAGAAAYVTRPDVPGAMLFGLPVDKLRHVLIFAMLIAPTAMLRPAETGRLALALFGLGVLLEAIQPIWGREGSLGDIAANTIGLGCGALVSVIPRRRAAPR